jgi:phosphoenolpyruvate carboxykinase (ATP)
LASGRATLTDKGVLSIRTGKFTGRSPKDRFIVRDEWSADRVWWGEVNIAFDLEQFKSLRAKVETYLSDKPLFVRDVEACADARFALKVRTVTEWAECSLFAHNMFLRLSDEQRAHFTPEWTLLHAPGFQADPSVDGTRQGNFAILCFSEKTILIGGTGYTGEIKKSIFSALNFLLPTHQNTLPMHCSANVGKSGDTALFFGLSGTGKTTLSADPNRKLIGDDEHGWAPDGTVFNFEGGCYAKVIDLSEEKEPDIFRAIRPGALLENIVFHEGTTTPDYTDSTITENTRVSYPIDHIDLIQVPSVGDAPQNIFFLTADAYGVLPAISKLSPEQAAYHFMSGYTAKVAGTEVGVTEPSATFSACFGAAFMPLHPAVYAEMLSKKLKDSNIHVWLVNTGWVGGAYGVGERIKLKYTRALITAALDGRLQKESFARDERFGMDFATSCPEVPSEFLTPRAAWADGAAYDVQADMLAGKFRANFTKFAEQTPEAIREAGPKA